MQCGKNILSGLLVVFLLLILAGTALSAENRRYRALPLGGESVFILDTRDGHMWLWRGAGDTRVKASGENPSVLYQGNVQKNVAPPKSSIPLQKGKPVPSRTSEDSRF